MATLFSFRRCPYAMRARMALEASGADLELVEVSLRNKPARMLELSPTGTVPEVELDAGRFPDLRVTTEMLDREEATAETRGSRPGL